MIRQMLKNQKGSVIVLATFAFIAMLGLAGITLDVGNLYLQKTKIQNAVDAAALGGGQVLPSTSSATTLALQILEANGENSSNAKISFSKSNLDITVKVIRTVPLFFMEAFGFKSVQVTAAATGELVGVGGPFNYAIFSGSKTISLPLNGSNFNIKGSVHTNQNLIINGSGITITGAAEADGTITKNGSNLKIGSLQSNSSFIAMPDYSNSIAAAAATANQVYTGSKTINGSSITANPMYVKGSPGTVIVNG